MSYTSTVPLEPSTLKIPCTASISRGWELTSGFKATYWIAQIFALLTIIGIGAILGLLLSISVGKDSTLTEIVLQLFQFLAQGVLGAGLLMLGIKRARGAELQPTQVFDYLDQALNLFLLSLLMGITVTLGFLLLIVPGIYLSIAYMFAIPLMADKGLSIWEAMETSRKAVSKQWFSYALFGGALGVINIIAALFLLIPLIWTVPMSIAAAGDLYCKTFPDNLPAKTVN